VRLRELVEASITVATALNPYIGYAAATSVAAEALASGRTVAALAVERNLLSNDQLESILSPENLSNTVTQSAGRPHRTERGIEREVVN
jgi:aspartate ammonia-lyase